MSHFLNRLLDRAEGRAPVLERRPRTLFEPRALDEAHPVESFAERVLPAAEVLPRAHPDAAPFAAAPRRAETPISTLLTDQSEIRPPRHAPEAMNAPHLPLPERAAPPAEPPRPRATRADARSERQEFSTVATKTIEAPARASARQNSGTQRTEPSRTPQKTSAAEATPAAQETTPVLALSHRIPAPTLRLEHGSVAESAVRLARAQTPAAQREPSAPAAPAPVQITIGRLEVRAVSDKPQSAAARKPSTPRLSLDAYLHQRHGGPR
jgi:hypothetical protein